MSKTAALHITVNVKMSFITSNNMRNTCNHVQRTALHHRHKLVCYYGSIYYSHDKIISTEKSPSTNWPRTETRYQSLTVTQRSLTSISTRLFWRTTRRPFRRFSPVSTCTQAACWPLMTRLGGSEHTPERRCLCPDD